MTTTKRIAVVTGGNKGIGLEICKQIAAASSNVLVILTARDVERGNAAVQHLRDLGLSGVVFHQLDILDRQSIETLKEFIRTQYRKLDILVNNAGVNASTVEGWNELTYSDDEIMGTKAKALKEFIKQTPESAEACLRTNYYGIKHLTVALMPLLQLSDSPKIVNLSSGLGLLKVFLNLIWDIWDEFVKKRKPEKLRTESAGVFNMMFYLMNFQYITHKRAKEELRDIETLTEDKIDSIVGTFLEDFKNDRADSEGWPINFSAYIVSKAALNAYTRVLAMEYPRITINCVSPGFCKTDMNENSGMLTAEEGARGPVMLALMEEGGPTGMYFEETRAANFEC